MTSDTQSLTPEADSEDHRPQGSPEEKAADLDELSDRLRSAKEGDEDIGEWIATNWQKLLGSLAVVLLVVYVYGRWQEAEGRKLGEAAQSFQEAQRAFGELTVDQAGTKPDKKADQEESQSPDMQQKTFDDNLGLLMSSYSDTRYGDFSPLYLAAAELKKGEFEAARNRLKKLGIDRFQGSGTARARSLNEDVFISELASLVYARLLIAEGKAPQAEIRQILGNLVSNARFANLEALIIMFRTSETPEHLDEAKEAAKKLSTSRPDLADTIKNELGNLGVSLE